MDFFTAMEVSATGLSAERTRMTVSASNLANMRNTRTAAGTPYQRQTVLVQSVPWPGNSAPGVNAVAAGQIVADTRPPRMEYLPGHPDANPNGYVAFPNVNMVEETVDMITAQRAYEAGVTALSTAVSMAERAIGIGR
jgi:flagellar basal-body rod protein FlgC